MLLTIIYVVSISLSVTAQKKDKIAIEASFDKFKTAILDNGGEEALNFVDSHTISYYSKISDAIKNADSIELNKLSLVDKLTVLLVRHRAPAEKLLSYEGEALFVYLIEEGMVGKDFITSVSLDKISIDDDFAKVKLFYDGEATGYYFYFYKENGVWRLDITSLIEYHAAALDHMASQSELKENDYILDQIKLREGTTPSSDVWIPLQP